MPFISRFILLLGVLLVSACAQQAPAFAPPSERPVAANETPWPKNHVLGIAYHDIEDRDPDQAVVAVIRYQIERLAELSLSADQLSFLERISFMKPDFLRFLGLFRFNLRYVHTGIENGELFIRLRGPWLHVILFEVPMLAIVSEVRNRYRYREVVLEQAREQLYRKFDWLTANASSDELSELQVADFGTRRRFSRAACGFRRRSCASRS